MGKEIEILAPAGSYETLEAAVCAGADAVYAGGSRFGARAYAQNFTEEELLRGIDYVHLHGKKLYLTVNTLLKEKEMTELYGYLLPFYRQGLDAVIVQDMGVMAFVKENFPDMAVHASTQMTITNVLSAKWLESQGVKRIVPARELSLEEIRDIADQTSLEIECFVHGALCYCYSGQCLLSSLIGGRSGNRGQCAQPCRLPYVAGKGKRSADIMSLKDLCTIDLIPELVEAGITSFKIEGRMKQPSYVAAVAGMYRKYADRYLDRGNKEYKVLDADKDKLLAAYQRRGYCEGYYRQHNGKNMISLERPNPLKEKEEPLFLGKLQEKINGKLILSPEKRAKLVLEYNDKEFSLEGDVCQTAKSHPLTEEKLKKQMNKTGNTPFKFDIFCVELDKEVFLPVQSLNELRRQGLAMLEEEVLSKFKRQLPDVSGKENSDRIHIKDTEKKLALERGFSVSVETPEQLLAVLHTDCVKRVYIEDTMLDGPAGAEGIWNLVKKAREKQIEIYFSMARIFRAEAVRRYAANLITLMEHSDGMLVRNLESLCLLKEAGYKKPVTADSAIYQWNKKSKELWQSFGLELTASLELNARELDEVGIKDSELIIYGYLPVMVSAGCIRKNTKECHKKSGLLTIEDRRKNIFYVKNVCEYCYNVIYNTAPLYLADQKKEILGLNPKRLRLQFTVEDGQTTEKVIKEFEEVFWGKAKNVMPEVFTRGHFKRGVK